MKNQALAITVLLLGGLTAQAQVFKCQDAAGKVVYSDHACGAAGAKMDERVLNSNTMDGSAARRDIAHERRRAYEGERNPALAASGSASTVCPSEQEIRNLETSANSIAYREKNKIKEREFLQAEIRRARACSKEGGTYTDTDWRRVKEAQAAQGNVMGYDRSAARASAEGVHSSSASAQEQERMRTDRYIQAQREEAERRDRERRVQEARRIAAEAQAREFAMDDKLRTCDGFGCRDQSGRNYNRDATGPGMTREDGVRCQVVGSNIRC